jgi:hypothetical protein
MNTILWNTSKKRIEATYDALPHHFAPDEKKILSFNTDYDKALVNHMLFYLEMFGLVQLSERATSDEVKKGYIKGVKNRWRQMDYLCRNFRTMNKEREASKMSAELPSDTVFEAAREAKELLAELRTLEAEKFKAVDDYLNDPNPGKAQDLLDESDQRVEVSGVDSGISGRKKGK